MDNWLSFSPDKVQICRIRQNGRRRDPNSSFLKSVASSPFGTPTAQTELPLSNRLTPRAILAFLLEIIVCRPMTVFGSDLMTVESGAYCSACKQLNSGAEAVFLGGEVIDYEGRVALSTRSITDAESLRACIEGLFEPDDALAAALSVFAIKANTLEDIVKSQQVREHATLQGLYNALFQSFRDKSEALDAPGIERPTVSMRQRQSSESQLIDALNWVQSGRAAEAEYGITQIRHRGVDHPELDFLQAFAAANQSKHVQALLLAQRQLTRTPNHSGALQLCDEMKQLCGELDQSSFWQHAASFNGIDGWTDFEQKKLLFKKVRETPNNARILEIGSFHGLSTAVLAAACLGSERHIECVDPFSLGNGWTDVINYNLQSRCLDGHVTLHRGFSYDVIADWSLEDKFDLVFIDGCHLYDSVKADFELVFPRMSGNAIVIFDDVGPDFLGCQRLWYELRDTTLHTCEAIRGMACGRIRPHAQIEYKRLSGLGETWVKSIAERFEESDVVVKALEYTLAVDRVEPENLETVEAVIQQALIPVHNELVIATKSRDGDRGGIFDAHLNYWNGLLHCAKGNWKEARTAFLNSRGCEGTQHQCLVSRKLQELESLRCAEPKLKA